MVFHVARFATVFLTLSAVAILTHNGKVFIGQAALVAGMIIFGIVAVLEEKHKTWKGQ